MWERTRSNCNKQTKVFWWIFQTFKQKCICFKLFEYSYSHFNILSSDITERIKIYIQNALHAVSLPSNYDRRRRQVINYKFASFCKKVQKLENPIALFSTLYYRYDEARKTLWRQKKNYFCLLCWFCTFCVYTNKLQNHKNCSIASHMNVICANTKRRSINNEYGL